MYFSPTITNQQYYHMSDTIVIGQETEPKKKTRRRASIMPTVKDMFMLTAGVVSAGCGLESFLLPNGFIDGGVTGMSLLTATVTPVPLSVLIVLLNIPFLILGYKHLGKTLAIRGALAIAGLALAITFIPYPVLTTDKLLVSVFGGFFLGAGIGLSVRGGGVLDGTEVSAIVLSKRLGVSIGDVILVFNLIIFSVAAYLLSMEVALYSILSYMSASKTVDFVIDGIEEYMGVTIISTHSDEVRQMIIGVMGRGVTTYSGKRGYGKRGDHGDMDIIYTVVTRLEIAKLQSELDHIDEHAFVVMSSIRDTRGGMIKKRAHAH